MRKQWWERTLDHHFSARADRLLKQKERLEEQRKRIEAQNKRGIKVKHKIERNRMKLQDNRIFKQQTTAFRRIDEARARGQKVTGIDKIERKKLSKERTWRGKWRFRRARFDTRAIKSKIR